MYVIGSFTTRTNVPFVAWPSPGYFPYQTLPSSKRWSFSVDQADFSSASVKVTGPDGSMPVTLEPVFNGFADNTLVFLVDVFGRPADETNYTVTVGYNVDGAAVSTSYDVVVYDPSFDGKQLAEGVYPSGSRYVTSREGHVAASEKARPQCLP